MQEEQEENPGQGGAAVPGQAENPGQGGAPRRPGRVAVGAGTISADDISAFHEGLSGFTPYTVARNAATSAGVRAAMKSPLPYRAYRDTYSVSLSPTGEVSNQRKTGRCWLFSAMNVLRDRMMSALGTTKLELSQAYLQFYDKLEKSNLFLEEMIRLAGRPIDDREVVGWLQSPAGDGGWWDSAVALIEKYGVVPQPCMPDTANSQASADMNEVLFRKLREDAMALRSAAAGGAGEAELRAMKEGMLSDVYRILAVALGEPPTSFAYEYVADARKSKDEDKDGEGAADKADGADGAEDAGEPGKPEPGSPEALEQKKAEKAQTENFVRLEEMTPLEFFKRFGRVDLGDFVSLGNVPGETRPYGSILRLDNQGALAGQPVLMLNVPIEVLKAGVIEQLKAGHPAWFACDVLKNMDRTDPTGLLDTETLDPQALFGMPFGMSKAASFDARETSLNHAMTFQGVNLGADGAPTAWRVENSWGKSACKDGYFVMTDRWFDAYVGQAIVHRDYLPKDVVDAWYSPDTPVVEMDPWSPMFGLSD